MSGWRDAPVARLCCAAHVWSRNDHRDISSWHVGVIGRTSLSALYHRIRLKESNACVLLRVLLDSRDSSNCLLAPCSACVKRSRGKRSFRPGSSLERSRRWNRTNEQTLPSTLSLICWYVWSFFLVICVYLWCVFSVERETCSLSTERVTQVSEMVIVSSRSPLFGEACGAIRPLRSKRPLLHNTAESKGSGTCSQPGGAKSTMRRCSKRLSAMQGSSAQWASSSQSGSQRGSFSPCSKDGAGVGAAWTGCALKSGERTPVLLSL